jgi:phosphinothricin acetyltransferase
MGFRLVGRFTRCGWKFGSWYDIIWMEKLIGSHPAAPKPVIPVAQL